MKSLDLFAGPGGWDEGVRPLGILPTGVEWDDDACTTRRAAGHDTLQADVSALDPLDFEGIELLLASSRYLQVGNAVPPLMARAIVGALVGA